VNAPSPAARRARAAVAALFFTNGALFASAVPRYPDLKGDLGLSNAAFGLAVAAYGLGALAFGLLAGVMVSRWGSVRVAPMAVVGAAANLVLLAVAPSWLALAAVLFVAGALDSIADVAENAHGLRVERLYRRSILNSMHGVWSIGAVVGGAMGAVAAGIGLSLVSHLAIASVLFATVAVVASRLLLPGLDDTERAAEGGAGRLPRIGRLHIARSVVALGLIAAMAQVMEDSTATWGAVYLRDDLGAAAAVSGLGFIALQTTQTVGRLLGDRVVTRYGDRAVGCAGTVLAGAAMVVALAFPGIVITVLALGAVGLGIGTLIPSSLRTADDIPGLPRGVGLSLVGTVPRIAILVAPPLVGIVADASSLRTGLLVIPLAAVLILVLARALPAGPFSRPG
jgi:MFS family permease